MIYIRLDINLLAFILFCIGVLIVIIALCKVFYYSGFSKNRKRMAHEENIEELFTLREKNKNLQELLKAEKDKNDLNRLSNKIINSALNGNIEEADIEKLEKEEKRRLKEIRRIDKEKEK